MAKYMIQIGESDNVLAGNNKQTLLKAYKEAVQATYEAYLNCCEALEEKPSITLSELMNFSEISFYDEWSIQTNRYEVEIVN